MDDEALHRGKRAVLANSQIGVRLLQGAPVGHCLAQLVQGTFGVFVILLEMLAEELNGFYWRIAMPSQGADSGIR